MPLIRIIVGCLFLAEAAWAQQPTTPNAPPATPSPAKTPTDYEQAPAESSPSAEVIPVEEFDMNVLSEATLSELEAIAMANHPAINRAVAEVAAARGRALQAGLYPNPVSMGGATQVGGSDTFWIGGFSQEFVVARKLYLQRQAELQGVRKMEFALTQIQFEVLRNVRFNFYRALALQRRQEALNELVAISSRSYESGVRLKKGGEGTLTDELQLKIQYRRAIATLKSTTAQLAAAKNSLAAVTGRTELRIGDIEGSLTDPLPDMEYPLVQAGVLVQNSQIGLARAEIQRRRYMLRRAIVEPIPNPNVQAAYQYYASTPHNQPMFIASLPIPIFNRNQGGVREARANVSSATANLRNTEVTLSNLAADAIGRLDGATELVVEYEKEILPAARQTVQLAQAAYQGGQFSLLQLLQAQRDLVDANLGYIDAQAQRWEAAVDIAQLLQLDSFPPTAP